MSQPIPQSAYLVANGTGTLYPTVIFARDPTLNDLNGPNGQKFQVTQRWVNSVTNEEWLLLNFFTSSGEYQANWVQIAGGSIAAEKLTGDVGVASASANNINVYGNTSPASTGLTFTGSGNTLFLGGDLVVANGGTGRVALTDHSVLVGAATSPVTQVGPNSASGIPLISQGLSSDPAFGTAVVAGGGTGNNAFTNLNSVLFTGATASTDPLQAPVTGTSGNVLTSNGPGVLPTWKAVGITSFAVAIQTFTISGTYTPTTGMSYCTIQVVGGGGAGGGAAMTGGADYSEGAGGGGGETSYGVFTAATIGASQTVTIGAGGTANSGTTGGNGGTTSVGALITANGGTGGGTLPPGPSGGLSGGAGGTGGSGGSYRVPGQNGGVAYMVVVSGIGISGMGGNCLAGFGGQDTVGLTSVGNPGVGFGGGGSGGGNSASQSAVAGGAGAPGVVVVTEYII